MFAAKWYADEHQLTGQPTDDALRAAFARCVRPPRAEIYPAIREAIRTYWDDDTSAARLLRERADSYARDAGRFRDACRLGQPITGATEDAQWASVYQVIADELRKTAYILQSVAS
jgi:hypothetical protein